MTSTERSNLFIAGPLRKFRFSLLLLLILIGIGTIGYIVIEGFSIVDALYMTIITITTVGFGEVQRLSQDGRIFTIVVIVLGVGTGAWAIRNGVEVVLGDALWDSMRTRRMKKTIDNLHGHFIVCGFGRIGRQIVRDMNLRHEKFLVIDQNPDRIAMVEERNHLYVQGDATLDETLKEAGIERARGLVASLNSDADNVLAVLTARGLNPGIKIVARAGDERAESKLRRAGADRVVSPYSIGGHRLALAILQPTVHDFFSRIFNVEESDVDIGEIPLGNDSPLVGRTIAEGDLRNAWNLIVIGVRRRDGEFHVSPDPRRMLETGETLIVIGDPEHIERYRTFSTGTVAGT